jgi:hypothetical protein
MVTPASCRHADRNDSTVTEVRPELMLTLPAVTNPVTSGTYAGPDATSAPVSMRRTLPCTSIVAGTVAVTSSDAERRASRAKSAVADPDVTACADSANEAVSVRCASSATSRTSIVGAPDASTAARVASRVYIGQAAAIMGGWMRLMNDSPAKRR